MGAEFAASARQRGADVTVIQPAAVPLERVLRAEIGALKHQRPGRERDRQALICLGRAVDTTTLTDPDTPLHSLVGESEPTPQN
jgi:NADPH-dependent 2,4-dienoyl-CoA reductase/sulfur reductase-like enzyme